MQRDGHEWSTPGMFECLLHAEQPLSAVLARAPPVHLESLSLADLVATGVLEDVPRLALQQVPQGGNPEGRIYVYTDGSHIPGSQPAGARAAVFLGHCAHGVTWLGTSARR